MIDDPYLNSNDIDDHYQLNQAKVTLCTVNTHCIPAVDVPEVDDDIDLWCPRLKLPLPGGHRGERHHHKEWTKELVLVVEPVEEGDGLDRLTKTHFIS